MGAWLGRILHDEISVEAGLESAAAEISALMPSS
jgi:hypothetical protein